MTVTKEEFVSKLAARMRVQKTEANDFLKAFEEVICKELSNGNEISLRGFMTMKMRHSQPRVRYVPVVGEAIDVPAIDRPVCKFGRRVAESLTRVSQ